MITRNERLIEVRNALKASSIDALLIPLSDPHLGEYIPGHWKIIEWLTGFTGSAATIVITSSFAGLWTDSRYFVQAGLQLEGSGFILMKPGPGIPSGYIDWLQDNLLTGNTLGFDGRIFPVSEFRKLEQSLKDKGIIISTETDVISAIWTDRPLLPSSKAWEHELKYAGKDRLWKLTVVRDEMKKRGVDLHLLTSPDDIMWLLNIRGNDLPYSPLCFSYALIGDIQVILFVDEKKIPPAIASDFDDLGIVILPYDEVSGMISAYSEGAAILVSPSLTPLWLYKAIPPQVRIVEDISIPSVLKAKKNMVEIENISKTMIRDGAALTKFLHWIDNNKGLVPMTELSLAVKLNEFRSQQEGYLGPSFPAIVAYESHAALPHYSATSSTDATLAEGGMLLVDSGGQYHGGTTDITRTISLGNPTYRQKKDFTLVLKGHIALAMAKFPLGTKGYQLDILARGALWQNGLNYGHGTGHGVGYCLNVHEGPQSISPADKKAIIEPGMLISNEPGIYREGEYGIRIENLIICYEDEETEFGKFLKFDTLSLCYIDRSLIDRSLLDKEETDWLNSYHNEVYTKLSILLNEEEKNWLRERTAEL
jgi:Xaa-Pro aminopeptidase